MSLYIIQKHVFNDYNITFYRCSLRHVKMWQLYYYPRTQKDSAVTPVFKAIPDKSYAEMKHYQVGSQR